MAHRLARLVYRMLNYGQQYVDKGTDAAGGRLGDSSFVRGQIGSVSRSITNHAIHQVAASSL